MPEREKTGKDLRGTAWGEGTHIWVMTYCIKLKNFSNWNFKFYNFVVCKLCLKFLNKNAFTWKKNLDMINCFRVIKNTEHPTAPVTTKCLGKFFSNLRPYSVSSVNNTSISSKKTNCRTSLVVKRLRICLPMLGMQGQSLTQGHSTSWGATKPVRPKYWSHTPETASNNYWACVH